MLIVKLTPVWPLLQDLIKSRRLSALFFVFNEDFHRAPGTNDFVCMRQESLNCFWDVIPYTKFSEQATFSYCYGNERTEQCASSINFPFGAALTSTETHFTVLWCQVKSRCLGYHQLKPTIMWYHLCANLCNCLLLRFISKLLCC